ncbi:MAG TPA: glycerophosphodiester phosphodiesterase [Candidatus Hydrogenedentes bacterium]|nr:glycerophosphodiester phosphodiesterase [Candidatus Hydrogenedentota bacterium]HRK33117.1 glycerophosphodiester phosphodiesterase [Candidatus Hydrogenedentota bacterium]
MYRPLIVLFACGIAFATNAIPEEKQPSAKPFFSGQFLLGAHRGGADLWPENTMFAFEAAAKEYKDIVLETDARLTADGEVVLLHDKTVNRTTDGTGEVTTLTLAQVRELDAAHDFTTDGGKTFPHRGNGIKVPTLREMLTALPGARVLVELKGEPKLADAAIAIINEAKANDRVLIASFVPETMDRARALAPNLAYCYDMKTGMSLLMALRGSKWDAYSPQADVLSVDEGMIPKYKITPEEIAKLQAKGIRFQVHTINDPARLREFVQLGVDGILTDRPDALAQVIAEMKLAAR